MNKSLLGIVLAIGILFSENVFSQQSYPYKNPKLNSEERTLDLLGRMTLAEKIGQLRCPLDRKSVV